MVVILYKFVEAKNNKKVQEEDFQKLTFIHKESGLPEFWLGGSLTYMEVAIGMGFDIRHNDYDLAVVGEDQKLNETIKILKENGFKITKIRPYYLKFNKASQIMAEKGKIILDIAILRDISHLGHFNWESIFWHFPSGIIQDKYNGLKALKKRKLLPIILATEENPFILASRFAKLCANFKIDFIKDRRLFRFAKDVSIEITKWPAKDFFQGKYARGHGYFNMLQAIVIASKRLQFISDLRKVGIFEAMFPEISKDILFEPDMASMIEKAKKVRDIIIALELSLREHPNALKKLKRRFELISDRLEKEK